MQDFRKLNPNKYIFLTAECFSSAVIVRFSEYFAGLTLVYPCIISIIVNDDQLDATILFYLFIPNKLYMFRAMFSPIIRST